MEQSEDMTRIPGHNHSHVPWTKRDMLLATAIGSVLVLGLAVAIGFTLRFYHQVTGSEWPLRLLGIDVLIGELALLLPVWLFGVRKYGLPWSAVGFRRFNVRRDRGAWVPIPACLVRLQLHLGHAHAGVDWLGRATRRAALLWWRIRRPAIGALDRLTGSSHCRRGLLSRVPIWGLARAYQSAWGSPRECSPVRPGARAAPLHATALCVGHVVCAAIPPDWIHMASCGPSQQHEHSGRAGIISAADSGDLAERLSAPLRLQAEYLIELLRQRHAS